MICTFGDVTDVIWWRELSLPVRAIIQPNGALRPVAWGSEGWESADPPRAQAALRPAGRLCRPPRRARRSSSCCSESGDLVGEPRPITHAVKFYEKGDRPLEIVTSRQWFIKTHRLPRARCSQRARELQWHPALHAGAPRELDQRPERRLVRQPPALLRRAVPGLVSACSPTASPRLRASDRAAGGAAADRSVHRRARRLPRRSARSARRVQRRSRRHGHVGDLVADAADRRRLARGCGSVRARLPDGRAAAGARHHPHVAVLDGAALPSGVRRAAVGARGDLRLGARSGSQEDVEVEGQRRHADGAARGARLRRRPLLGGQRRVPAPTRRSIPAR